MAKHLLMQGRVTPYGQAKCYSLCTMGGQGRSLAEESMSTTVAEELTLWSGFVIFYGVIGGEGLTTLSITRDQHTNDKRHQGV